jgi:hypothetical protein
MPTTSLAAVLAAVALLAVAGPLAAEGQKTPTGPVFDVPRLEKIVIDGKADDWKDAGFRVDVLVPLHGRPKPVSDLDARARLGWNAKGLLLLLEVRDDQWIEAEGADLLWQADGIELYLAPAVGDANVCQWVIAPGMAPGRKGPRWHLHDHRKDAKLKKLPAAVDVARTKAAQGYTLEALLPWSALAIEPAVGREVGFQFWVNDVDREDDLNPYHGLWFPGVGVFMDTTKMQRLRLAESPSPPADVRITGRHDMHRLKTAFELAARPDAAGKEAQVVHVATGDVLAETRLSPEAGGYALARVRVPLPASGKPYDRVGVRVGGRVVDECSLGGVDQQRRRAWERARIVFRPFVFGGKRLPEPDFERPVYVEQLVGDWAFRTSYYDANYNEVTTADRPGRYGAIVEVTCEQAEPRTAFLTLYRTPEPVNWWQAEVAAELELPAAFGVASQVLETRDHAVGEQLKWTMHEAVSRDEGLAVLLAGLHEAAAGEPDVDRTAPWAKNNWWWHGLRKKTGRLQPLPYAVHLPDGATVGGKKTFPTALFLHGSGERGFDPNRMLNRIFCKHVRDNKLPMIVILPVCPKGQWWSTPKLKDLIDEVFARYPVDRDRFYLTGLSMGGYGSWSLVAEYPDLFAAVAPICGGGDPRDVARYKHVPIWVFHGDADGAVPVQRSREMVEALEAVGGNVTYTEYPGVGHASWVPTYKNPELYKWLLARRRGKAKD